MILKEMLDKAKGYLVRRQQAYRAVFSEESQASKRVLKDLAKFCRANESTFHGEQRIHAVLEGRREVWLRIMKHTKLDTDQFWKEYGREDLDD